MTGTNYKSCLVPFENEILALRRRRPPMSFPQIAAYLREKHQISVRRQTIEAFLKVRMKGYKTCKYAWEIEPVNNANQPATEVPPVSAKPQTTVSVQKEVTQPEVKEAEQTVKSKSRDFDEIFQFSETYNLTRLSNEEAAERLKKLEERKKLKQKERIL